MMDVIKSFLFILICVTIFVIVMITIPAICLLFFILTKDVWKKESVIY
jgi:hypothetical protein